MHPHGHTKTKERSPCPPPSPCSESAPASARPSPAATHERATTSSSWPAAQEPLDLLAKDLSSAGATAHVVTADLSDTDATPRLAEQIRAKAGDLDALYYAPTPSTGFVSAANLTPQYAQKFMPLIFYTLLALVQEFLPHMLEQGDGAILTAQGGSTVQGLPNMSGPSPAQAAQRNYLQALHAEVAEKGVYVGMLYIGAAIEHSAFHAEMERPPRLRASQSGRCRPSTPSISPTCSGPCTARGASRKPSIPRVERSRRGCRRWMVSGVAHGWGKPVCAHQHFPRDLAYRLSIN